MNPDEADWERIASEVISMQNNPGATLLPPVTSGGPITVIDDDEISYPLTTSAIILADATGGAFTINFPSALSMSGQTLSIKKIDATANTITLDADGSETIDDELTQTLTTQYDSINMVSNGIRWFII